MGQSVKALVGDGLITTLLGMTLVFAGLGLLWGLMALLTRLFAHQSGEIDGGDEHAASVSQIRAVESAAAQSRSVERARVAAIVAGALLANALPLHMEAPAGPTFEHGRTAPSWVTANRARTMRCWQPGKHQGSQG